MKYLLDTDWAISFLNAREDAVELVGRLAQHGLAISVVSYGEVYEGLLGTQTRLERMHQFEAFAATLDLLLPDILVARRYGEIRAVLRASGQLLADNDLWIAATALAHDLVLVTRDGHFSRVPDLKLLPHSKEKEPAQRVAGSSS